MINRYINTLEYLMSTKQYFQSIITITVIFYKTFFFNFAVNNFLRYFVTNVKTLSEIIKMIKNFML